MRYVIDIEKEKDKFIKSMHDFRLMRAEALEIEYHDTNEDIRNRIIRDMLYDEIMSLLGVNMKLMIEFADRDAACYNPETDFFYNRGFDDCLIFLNILYSQVGKNIPLKKFLKYGQILRRAGKGYYYKNL